MWEAAFDEKKNITHNEEGEESSKTIKLDLTRSRKQKENNNLYRTQMTELDDHFRRQRKIAPILGKTKLGQKAK